MGVKRYEFNYGTFGAYGEKEDGQWVRFDDYAALEAECERLRDLYKKMTESRDDWRDLAQRGEQSTGGS